MASASTLSHGQYLLHPKQFETRDVEIGRPGQDEVLIAPRSTTLCGSDLHYYNHGRNGSILIREPLCLGHEFAGQVIAVGCAVESVQPGDKVAIECGVPCSKCELCIDQRYNLCQQLRFRGSGSAFPHFQGSLQSEIIHPAKWVHRLPECLSLDDGALLEPLAVACHAVRRAQVVPASTCLIYGAGAIGLLCAAVARFKGCSRIAICDIDEMRVQFALQHGFADSGTMVPRRKATNVDEEMENARALAKDLGSLKWPDQGGTVGKASIVFECTGVPSCVQSAIYASKSGGRVMLVGMGTPNHTLPLSEAGAREVDLMPTWRYAHCYKEAIELMTKVVEGSFKPDIREIITHRFRGLESVREAFSLAGTPRDPDGNLVIKVVIRA